eukprot:1993388-Rhodomonas_salina.2
MPGTDGSIQCVLPARVCNAMPSTGIAYGAVLFGDACDTTHTDRAFGADFLPTPVCNSMPANWPSILCVRFDPACVMQSPGQFPDAADGHAAATKVRVLLPRSRISAVQHALALIRVFQH